MNNVAVMVVLAGLMGCLIASNPQVAVPTEQPSIAEVQKMLAWMPADTETLAFCSAPPKSMSNMNKTLSGAAKMVSLIGMMPLKYTTPAFQFKFVLKGMRHFTPPNGLGLCRYEGCSITSIDPSEKTAFEKYLAKSAKNTTTVNGLKAYVVQSEQMQTTWTQLVVIDKDLVFSATQRNFLADVLTRRANRSYREAIPDSLREWKYVDLSSSFWAIRHRTEDLETKSMGISPSGPKSYGFAAYLSKDEKSVNITSLTQAPGSSSMMLQLWKSDGKKPIVLKNEPETLTIEYRESSKTPGDREAGYEEENQAGMISFYMLAAFGHMVYL